MIRKILQRQARLEPLERRLLLASAGGTEEPLFFSRTEGVIAIESGFADSHHHDELHVTSTLGASMTIGDVAIDAKPPVLPIDETGEIPGPPLRNYVLAGWQWPTDRIPIPYYINTSNLPSTVNEPDYISAVQGAFNAWGDIPTTTIRFTYRGAGTQYGTQASDSMSTVGFGTAVSGALAHATTYSDGAGVTEFDVVLGDDRATWSAASGVPGGSVDVCVGSAAVVREPAH